MRRQGLYDPSLRLRVGTEVELLGRDRRVFAVVTREPVAVGLSVIVQEWGDDFEQHWPPNHICRVVWSFNGPIRCVK